MGGASEREHGERRKEGQSERRAEGAENAEIRIHARGTLPPRRGAEIAKGA